MSNRLQAGFSIYGEHSYNRDMLMSSYSFPTPKMKEIKETVPYMSGSYDFSFLYGKPSYEDRQISFEMIVFCNDYQDRSVIITDIKKWLYGKPMSQLRCDVYENLEYYVKCVDIEPEILSYGINFKIVFEGHPFARNVIDNSEVI